MVQGRIYVRNARRFTPNYCTPETMTHEAAHARHDLLGEDFSAMWEKRFPIQRGDNPNDFNIMDKNGLVSIAAAYDYKRDGAKTVFLPQTPPVNVFDDDPVKIELYNTNSDPNIRAQILRQSYERLPSGLQEAVSIVAEYQGLGFSGVYSFEDFDDKTAKTAGRCCRTYSCLLKCF